MLLLSKHVKMSDSSHVEKIHNRITYGRVNFDCISRVSGNWNWRIINHSSPAMRRYFESSRCDLPTKWVKQRVIRRKHLHLFIPCTLLTATRLHTSSSVCVSGEVQGNLHCRLLTLLLSCLPKDLLTSLLQLAVFPGCFEAEAAKEVLGAGSTQCLVTTSLHKLCRWNFAQYNNRTGRWRLLNCVAQCAREFAAQLGLPFIVCRWVLTTMRTAGFQHACLTRWCSPVPPVNESLFSRFRKTGVREPLTLTVCIRHYCLCSVCWCWDIRLAHYNYERLCAELAQRPNTIPTFAGFISISAYILSNQGSI